LSTVNEAPAESAPDSAARRRKRLWIALFLALAPILLIGPALLPGKRFLPQLPASQQPLAHEHPELAQRGAELANQWCFDRIFPSLSDQVAFRERFAEDGVSALWTSFGWEPDMGFGLPLLGNTISGPLYPPNGLALFADPAWAAAPLAFLALYLAGLFLWLFLARLGFDARVVAVVVFGYQATGWGVANLHYGMKVDAALWLPLALYAIEGLARGRYRDGFWLTLAVGLPLLAGFPPIALFSACAAGVYALIRLGRLAPRFGNEAAPQRALGRAFLHMGCGLLIALWQLLPNLEASSQSLRGEQRAEAVALQALPLGTWLSVPMPDFFGEPTLPTPPLGPAPAWWMTPVERPELAQNAQPLEWSAYAGAALFLLALAGAFSGDKRGRYPLVLLALAFGWTQGWPGFSVLYQLPGLNGGAPSRALSVAWMAWPWLAAVGLQGALDQRLRARSVWFLSSTTAVLIGGLLTFTTFSPTFRHAYLSERFGRSPEEVAAVLPPEVNNAATERLAGGGATLAWAGFLGLLALSMSGRVAGRRRLQIASGLILIGQIGEAAFVSRAHVHPRDLGDADVWPESAALAEVAHAAGDGRVLRLDHSESGAGELVQLARPNMLPVYGVADTSAYVAFTPASQVDYFVKLDPKAQYSTGMGAITREELLDHPRLDRARITCVLSATPIDHARLEPVRERSGWNVYRRSGAAPMAWLETVLGEPLEAEVTFERPRPDVLRARIATPLDEPAQVVFSEQYALGWVGQVEGRRRAVERDVSGALMQVRLGPGEQEVELRYRPLGLRIGPGALLLGLAVAGYASRRRLQ
jgi:hypothetical protein